MKPRNLLIVLTLIVGVLLNSACASVVPTPTRPPLKVAWNIWPGGYPLVVGVEKGIFAKHGVNVELIYYATYTAQYTDFATAKMDGVIFSMGDLLVLTPRVEAKSVLVTDYSVGADQFVATPSIQTIADLRGKRIGISQGTYSELFIREVLADNGLSPDDVQFVNTPLESVSQAMGKGIDAGHTYEPFTSEAVAGGAHVLFTSEQVPGLIPALLTFRASVVEERPEDIRAFVAAWFEAVDWWNNNTEEGKAIVAQAAGVTPEEIWTEGDTILNRADNHIAFTQSQELTSLYYVGDEYIQFLIKTGTLTKAPDINELLDPSFQQ